MPGDHLTLAPTVADDQRAAFQPPQLDERAATISTSSRQRGLQLGVWPAPLPPTNRPRQPAARDTSSSSAGVGGGLSGSAAECQKGQRGTFSARRRQRLKDAVGRRSDILPHGAVEEPLLQATPTATQPSIQQLAMPHLSVSGHAPGSCTTSLPIAGCAFSVGCLVVSISPATYDPSFSFTWSSVFDQFEPVTLSVYRRLLAS